MAAREFQTFNMCLDEAIAAAVTEYARVRERQDVERVGLLAHELRNLLEGAVLAFEVLKTGNGLIAGSTGDVLSRSLAGLSHLIEREIAGVRFLAGVQHREDIAVGPFIENVKAAATMRANSHNVRLSVDSDVQRASVNGDRVILDSVAANLLHNAFKFTRRGGHVTVNAHATDDRVFIEVEDECGGLPPGKADELFTSFAQRGADRTGLGLGLGICARGAHLHGGAIRVLDRPGTGCVFTLELPRQASDAT
jgi:signal transduction histidine kinase